MSNDNTIGKRARDIERARGEEMDKLMRIYDETVYYPARHALQAECEAAGHKWTFTHCGPTDVPWYSCGRCLKSQARPTETK